MSRHRLACLFMAVMIATPTAQEPARRAPRAAGAIDAMHLMKYVEDQTAMSRRYRDSGHQFWGRITGTAADAENAEWLAQQFRRIGLSDAAPIEYLKNAQAFDGAANSPCEPAASRRRGSKVTTVAAPASRAVARWRDRRVSVAALAAADASTSAPASRRCP